MLIALVVLSILCIIFLVLALSKSHNFKVIARLNEQESKINIQQLALSLRSTKEVGGAPKTMLIRKNLSDNYFLICKKVKNNVELYELERWLYENYHTIISKFNANTFKDFALLPHNGQDARILHLTDFLLNTANYKLDINSIKESILNFNSTSPLRNDEVFALKRAFTYSIIKKIGELSQSITELYYMEKNAKNKEIKKKYLKYLSYLYFCEQNNKSIDNVLLKKNNEINVDNVRYLFQTDLLYKGELIANCINSLNYIEREFNLNFELSINYSNIIMKTDKNYRIMDNESKIIYLNAINKLANNLNVSEKNIINSAFYLSKKLQKHFGEFFFEDRRILKHYILANEIKKYPNHKKHVQYLFSTINFAASIIFSVLVGLFFMNTIWLSIISAVFSFFAIFPIVENITCRIYRLFIIRKPIPKLDYKCLPDNAKTLVIMPVFTPNINLAKIIVNNIIEIRESNQGENISFALLVDFTPAKSEIINEDAEIIKLFENSLSSYTDINVFVRKRVLINGKYQAYEKKRGAIIDLNNALINGNKSKFAYILRDNFSIPEYIVTLDEDNKLLPKTVLEAVNTIMHPLNEKYDLMTFNPRYNIFSLKTIFSKQFYYSGGFDRYDGENNFYYDLCGKSIFSGKGIYRLNSFTKKLNDVFPDNTVLSHDIIEGALVNTGALKQIVFEDAPSTMVSDVTRQNRWFKGDLLLARFIPNKFNNAQNKKIKTNKAPIYNYIMSSNILRGIAPIALFALLITSFALQNPYLIGLFFLINLIVPFADMLRTMNGLSYNVRYIYVIKSLLILLITTVFNVVTLPFYAINNALVIAKTLYSLIFNRKNLLRWKTFASTQKINKFPQYLILIAPSVIIMFIFSMIFINSMWIVGYSAIFTAITLCLYSVNVCENDKNCIKNNEKEFLLKTAENIYKYFKDAVGKGGLVADNIQIKPYKGKSKNTSPTNIGFSLLAEISACELGIITISEAEINIKNKLDVIQKLDKFKGNLYNWYDIDSCEVVSPRYVSSVDQGNFIACVLVVREFLRKYSLYGITACDNIIGDTDLAFLYDNEKQMFYIGYNVNNGEFEGHYDILASESRLLYYIYSAYYCNPSGFLNTKRENIGIFGNTLLSWSGTMFEYLMPRLFINCPDKSLLGSSEKNCVKLQRKRSCNYLWGISESGYNKFDENLNYQYFAFGINELAMRNSSDKCIISPYSTFLALQVDFKHSFNNLMSLKRADLTGEYGFYESVDFTNGKKIVYSYMSHHQGMSICSITNVLKKNIFNELFMANPKLSSNKMLLAERRLTTKSYIKPKEDFVYAEKINYADYAIQNERFYTTGTLSNGKYKVVYDYTGSQYSKINDDIISKFRYDKRENYGLQSYIEDSEESKSYYNCGIDRNKNDFDYKFNPFKLTFSNKSTNQTEEIFVPHCMNGEVHQYTLYNNSTIIKTFTAVSHMPIKLTDIETDISHPTFSDLFVESKVFKKGVLYTRKDRANKAPKFLAIACIGQDIDFIYSVAKDKCIERITDKVLAYENSNVNKESIEVHPYFCVKGKINIAPNSKESYNIILRYSDNEEELLTFIDEIDVKHVEFIINTAKVKTLSVLNMNHITAEDFLKQSNILYRILYMPYASNSAELLSNSHYYEHLKHLGINMDKKIIVIDYKNNNNFLRRWHYAFNYISNFTDIFTVIIQYTENNAYYQSVKNTIKTIINNAKYSLNIVERDDNYSLEELSFINCYDYKYESISEHNIIEEIDNSPQNQQIQDYSYQFASGSGGFVEQGYLIDKPTFAPYCNVICLEHGGTVVSENGGGFTYFDNSRNNKVTTWYNEPISDKSSESIYLKNNNKLIRINKRLENSIAKHGLGETVFINNIKNTTISVSERMILNGRAKVITIDNVKENSEYILDFDFALNYKNQQAFLKYDLKDDILKVMNISTLQECVLKVLGGKFVVCHDKINLNDTSSKLWKISHTNNNKVYIIITKSLKDIENLNIENVEEEKLKAIQLFQNLNKLTISTDNKALNYLFNDWLLYQTMSARLNGKCGFYQVGGAIGFRDQLQDCLAMLYSDAKYVKSHILECSERQFIEGDVLHWWHNPAIGVRTRISDDKLFLPFLVCEYIKVTGDKSILWEETAYLIGETLQKHEEDKYLNYQLGDYKESIYSHCIRAFDNALRFGKHNLLLIGSGDWNDALNAIGTETNGESVWLSMFAYYVLKNFLIYVKDDKYNQYISILDRLRSGVNNAFDGAWFKRAITSDDEWLGSSSSNVCKIDLICQSFAVISEISDYNRLQLALNSCDKLIDSNNMLVKLLTPPFNNDKYYGYISAYPEGVRENGGQYTHAVTWYIKALSQINPNKAYDILNMINPININIANASKYRNEPYVLSGDVYTNGKGGWSWYTGSSSWLYKVILEDILGFSIINNKIVIKPKSIDKLLNYNITYRYQNNVFNIKVQHNTESFIIINSHKQITNIFEIDLDYYSGNINVEINYIKTIND